MPSLQTTYGVNIVAGYPGMVQSMEPSDRISMIVETAAGIGFGVPVCQGTGDRQAKVAGAGLKFRGVSIASPDRIADLYEQYGTLPVMVKGTIWVTASVAVGVGDIVTWTTAGAWSNTGGTTVPNAIWDTAQATIGGIAVIRLG